MHLANNRMAAADSGKLDEFDAELLDLMSNATALVQFIANNVFA